MSLATSIKDFTDLLTEISTAKGLTGDFPKVVFLQQALLSIVQIIFSLVVYLFSFQWLRDVSYLPLFTVKRDIASLLGENMFTNPASHMFSFPNMPRQGSDQLVAGFVNSFFLSLPVSLPHLISLRRLFSQGPAAAAASLGGIVVAHSIFLIGVVYGLRFLIVPYFALEPLNYIIGVFIVAVVVKDFAQQKGFQLVPSWKKVSLFRMGILTFLLTWCEESVLLHSLNHLTLNAQTSYFDLYSANSAFNSFLVQTTYITAFFIGHCLFSISFYYCVFLISRYLSSLRYFTTAIVTVRLSQSLLFLIVAFSVSSFPYYGLDYLVTNVAGFLPEDPIYSNTLFSPTAVQTKYPHFFKEIPPAQRDQKTALNLDLNYFDRGMYLNAPKQQKNLSSSTAAAPYQGSGQQVTEGALNQGGSPATPMPALSFEELNYQGEYAWIMRNQLSKDLSKMRPSVFTPMFKKPRRRYLQLKTLNDSKMEEAARAAYKKRANGSLTQAEEGFLPQEQALLFIKMSDFLGRALFSPLQTDPEINNSDVIQENARHVPGSAAGIMNDSTLEKTREVDSRLQSLENSESQKREIQSFQTQRNTQISPIRERQYGPGSAANTDLISEGVERFNSFAARNTKKDVQKEESLFETKMNKSYSKGFAAPFSLPYERMRSRYLPVKNVIKKRYFLNNMYRSLLQIDIDSFLARQPANRKLAENQEFQLFQKRQILQKYYNWLRYYEPIEKMMTSHFQIPDSRSFVDRVYHQQFKGTLRVARRLFKVTFDSQQNLAKSRVLSYDQLLYKENEKDSQQKQNQNPYLHEELWNKNKNLRKQNQYQYQDQDESLSSDSEKEQKKRLENENLAENVFSKENQLSDDCWSCYPFIEESSSSPTYAGWDPLLRRFIVTNQFVLKALS